MSENIPSGFFSGYRPPFKTRVRNRHGVHYDNGTLAYAKASDNILRAQRRKVSGELSPEDRGILAACGMRCLSNAIDYAERRWPQTYADDSFDSASRGVDYLDRTGHLHTSRRVEKLITKVLETYDRHGLEREKQTLTENLKKYWTEFCRKNSDKALTLGKLGD